MQLCTHQHTLTYTLTDIVELYCSILVNLILEIKITVKLYHLFICKHNMYI